MALGKVLLFIGFISSSISVTRAKDIADEFLLTLREKQILDVFKERMIPIVNHEYMKTDFYLIRWLRARNFDLPSAQALLVKDLTWRKNNNMDNVGFENFEDMKTEFPSSVNTQDKLGRPVGTLDIGQWNFRNAIVTGRGERLSHYMDMLMENVTKQVFEKQKKGLNVTQWNVVMNAENVNMISHGCPLCISIWIQFVNSLENHYPGWLNECIIIEASPAVHMIFNMVRPIASPTVRERIRVFGTDKRKWMSYLDSIIRREERREHYGGTKDQCSDRIFQQHFNNNWLYLQTSLRVPHHQVYM